MQVYSRKNARQFKAIKLKFKRRSRGFARKFRIPLYFLLIAASLDCITTINFMLYHRSVMGEGHQYIRWISLALGPIAGPVAGKIFQLSLGIPVVIFVRKYASIILWGAGFLYLFAAWHNLFTLGFFFY